MADKGRESRNKKQEAKNFKGLVTAVSNNDLPLNVLAVADNVVFDIEGAARKREGFEDVTKDSVGKILLHDEINIDVPKLDKIDFNESTFDKKDKSMSAFDKVEEAVDNNILMNEWEPKTDEHLNDKLKRTLFVFNDVYDYKDSGIGFLVGKLKLNYATTIRAYAFASSQLTSLSLPKVTTIGTSTFASSQLTSLTLPEATTIGYDAFRYSQLTSLSLPKATTIGGYAFNNSHLTSLTLPEATTIGDSAFNNSKLTSLSLPKATTIGVWAFFLSPLTSLSLPKVQTIGDQAFFKIVNAPTTTVTLPSKFNTASEKERIFGGGDWNNITFTWV